MRPYKFICTGSSFLIPQKRWRLSAWLGLFAMVMAFVAPVVSQGLYATGNHSHESHSHSMGQGESLSGHVHGTMPSSNHKSHWAYVWEKCGYCDLIFSNPPLSSEPAALVGYAPQMDSLYQAVTAPGFACSPVFLGALTRAPPLTA
jgi:hypothetical protein